MLYLVGNRSKTECKLGSFSAVDAYCMSSTSTESNSRRRLVIYILNAFTDETRDSSYMRTIEM